MAEYSEEITAMYKTWPVYQIEAKIEKDEQTGATYYRQGELQFPADLKSLGRTYDLAQQLNALVTKKLLIDCGFPLHDLVNDEERRCLLSGCVQNTWYLCTRGHLPDGVIRHHTDRVARYLHLVKLATENPTHFQEEEMAKKKQENVAGLKSRSSTVFQVNPEEKSAAQKEATSPQLRVVYEALARHPGGLTRAKLTEAVQNTPEFKASINPRAMINNALWFMRVGKGPIRTPGLVLAGKSESVRTKPESKAKAKPKAKPKAKSKPKAEKPKDEPQQGGEALAT
jgi:hypothetical protein